MTKWEEVGTLAVTHRQIDEWLGASSEHQRLEFKEAKVSFSTEKLNQYCVALANEGGGHLLLGVSDKPPRAIIGTSAFPDLVKTQERLFQKIGFRVDVEEVWHPKGRVLVFQAPSRPQGTAYHLDGRYLMRSGSSLVAMSEDRLRAIFAEGEPDWLEGHSKTSLSTDQVAELLDLEAYFELIGLPCSEEPARNVERLVAERLIDGEPGSHAIRRIGALLLARNLRDFPDVQRKAARIIVYPGRSKLETRLDQTEKQGYALGFQNLVGSVMKQLPREVIENGLRRMGALVPEVAVRELVANALIHQDFSISGTSVVVEIYRDRMEISNPGKPIVPVERFIDGYQSRNERLAAPRSTPVTCHSGLESSYYRLKCESEFFGIKLNENNMLFISRYSVEVRGKLASTSQHLVHARPHGLGSPRRISPSSWVNGPFAKSQSQQVRDFGFIVKLALSRPRLSRVGLEDLTWQDRWRATASLNWQASAPDPSAA